MKAMKKFVETYWDLAVRIIHVLSYSLCPPLWGAISLFRLAVLIFLNTVYEKIGLMAKKQAIVSIIAQVTADTTLWTLKSIPAVRMLYSIVFMYFEYKLHLKMR